MAEIILLLHNIRSTHNVGSIFRTAEGFGVSKIIVSGYTPYPKLAGDSRLPYLAEKIHKQITKTALGAENMVAFDKSEDIFETITKLKSDGYRVVGLEQDERSVMLPDYKAPAKIALLLGEEVEGINSELRTVCDDLIEIPMVGRKESFNVSVATAIALYGLTLV